MHLKNPFANRLLSVIEKLSTAGAVLSGVTFGLMTLLILAEIMLRTFFDKSTLIASEYSGYTLAAMIYLGLGFSFRQGAHIRITFLRERLSGWPFHFLEIICASIGSVLCILSTLFLAGMVHTSYIRGTTAYTVAETPLWIPQAVILVGLIIMTLQILAYLFYLVMSGPEARNSKTMNI
ncbi:MAG: DctQ-like TRAP transporter subunit [Desulfobacterales bacterium]|nr:MAG: DctQ-like TRAP transporter subunit [Desulfobacterales bacterium]